MRTIFITGSTDGIGKLTALQLAQGGHRILLHGRSASKVQAAVSEIMELSGNTEVCGFVYDLSDLRNMGNLITEVTREVSKIDVLINNAGVFHSAVPLNADGLDLRFVVNYLAPFLLTEGLLPLLKKGDSPRLINLSSAAQASVRPEALRGTIQLSSSEAYAQSKLALTMWSFYLAGQWEFLTVIAVNPGSLLNTKMVQEAYGQFWSPADKGADILVELAVGESAENRSGGYFDNDKGMFSDAHPDAYHAQKLEHLVLETRKILKV